MRQKRAWKLGVAIALGALAVSGATMAVVSCSQGSDATTPSKPEPTPVELFEFDPSTQTITKYNGGETQYLTIPNEIDGVPVKKIGPKVFYGKSIFVVQLPNQLEEIGDSAFCGNYLFELTIPASVRIIGDRAFQLNEYLQKVTFEEGNLEQIGVSAFNSCDKLLSVQLPDSLANPEAKPLGAASFWSEQLNYWGTPKKVSMREGTRLQGSHYDVFTVDSEIYIRNGISTTDPNKPTEFNANRFIQVVNEITNITDYKKFDAEDMTYTINNYSNAEIVAAVNKNKNEMFTNPGENLGIANIKVSAIQNGQSVNIIIDGVPESNGQIWKYTTTLRGFDKAAPIPAGYEYNKWAIGDTFEKDGFTYEMIRNPKRTFWPNQPKYALKLVDADLTKCKLDHMADDNTGKVTTSNDNKGKLSLDVLVIGSNLICKEYNKTYTLGQGEAINLIVPDSVYKIEYEAFGNISNQVTQFSLGRRLESIDDSAFNELHYSGTLNIPKTVAYIGNSAFACCDFTGKIELPPKLKVLPYNCFTWCAGVSEFVINDGLERIETGSMYILKGVSKDIYIPDSVQYIGGVAFGGCIGHPITVSYPHHLSVTSGQYGNYTNWKFVQRSN